MLVARCVDVSSITQATTKHWLATCYDHGRCCGRARWWRSVPDILARRRERVSERDAVEPVQLQQLRARCGCCTGWPRPRRKHGVAEPRTHRSRGLAVEGEVSEAVRTPGGSPRTSTCTVWSRGAARSSASVVPCTGLARGNCLRRSAAVSRGTTRRGRPAAGGQVVAQPLLRSPMAVVVVVTDRRPAAQASVVRCCSCWLLAAARARGGHRNGNYATPAMHKAL